MPSIVLRSVLFATILGVVASKQNKQNGECEGGYGQYCEGGETRLKLGATCTPRCARGAVPLGQFVCRKNAAHFAGPGCVDSSQLVVVPSEVDAVADATIASDMLFKNFAYLQPEDCLIWPSLRPEIKKFIFAQAGKYGPSASAIRAAARLGSSTRSEFFLSIEQVSILLAQLLCGATSVAEGDELPRGSSTQPQAFAFGRAMGHWYFAEDGSTRERAWRRTTLVGYGTFGSDPQVPNASSSVRTTGELAISPGCGAGDVADWGLGDRDTLTVVFAGRFVGGWLSAWYHHNTNGAQEEKFGTLVPEMMLATEPLRRMGAGLLSNGLQDPWLPAGGWYILGAGTYVKSKGYPKWSSERLQLSDTRDYFEVGKGRRMRRRGIVAILGKPCNDRGTCHDNTDDPQYRCYNRQVLDHDMDPAPHGANLWGIAAGAFNFANWPSKTRHILEAAQAERKWLLQAGGWGAGAFGCGTLYSGLLQALAAKSGGWRRLRMCWATRRDSEPSVASKMGYTVAGPAELRNANVVVNDGSLAGAGPTLLSWAGGDPGSGRIVLRDDQFGAVARQLQTTIHQIVLPPTCSQNDDTGVTIKCNKPWNDHGDCISNMEWCCEHPECKWHENRHEDLRDFSAANCNFECGVAFGLCKLQHVPLQCRKTVTAKQFDIAGRSADADSEVGEEPQEEPEDFLKPGEVYSDIGPPVYTLEATRIGEERTGPASRRNVIGWLVMMLIPLALGICVCLFVAWASGSAKCDWAMVALKLRKRGPRRPRSRGLELGSWGEQLASPLSVPGATPSTESGFSDAEDGGVS